MHQIYCIGSIYNAIDKLEAFIKICDASDTLYLIGNFSIASCEQKSQVTYLYLYNLIQQKILKPKINLPTIKLIKGKNESKLNLHQKDLNQLVIYGASKYLLNMQITTLFDFEQNLPTNNELFNFYDALPYYEKINNLILVSGFYNVHLAIETQLANVHNDNEHGLIFGSPGKITKTYYDFCKQNQFHIHTKSSLTAYLNTQLNYEGYQTIEQYHNDLIKHNLMVICGNYYDPLFIKNLNITNWSHLYMIDGGINRSYNNENGWFYFEPNQERFNILNITDINNIKLVDF